MTPGRRAVTMGTMAAAAGVFLSFPAWQTPPRVSSYVTAPAPAPTPVATVAASLQAAGDQPAVLPVEQQVPARPAPLTLAAAPPRGPSVAAGPAMPYRVIGRSTTGSETALVLFGRGRVVTLQGPGPLDDEYAVEAVFDDYLVVRHGPSGTGSFLPTAPHRRASSPAQDPEASPRD